MNRNAEPPPFSKELVISAYCQGIFPMGDDDGTISWYSPDPRCIFDFDLFHVSSRLKRTIRQGIYDVRINTCFEEVMWACADRESTWINEEIVRVYVELHELGLAHSVETFFEEKLVGGLYGVSLGGAFMGESMFFRRTDASKVALVYLVERLKERGFILLDTQYQNKHLASFNSQLIARKEYLARLSRALELDCRFD
ncbi:MAG: leucyl/phenylalanyl-tRNA--protein transferase [Candidatus Melainabacteria bacterium]|nr:leucyl/phenylalanyl-tRNA--protein transferase [Candidatus Melainabacteria bacterium]